MSQMPSVKANPDTWKEPLATSVSDYARRRAVLSNIGEDLAVAWHPFRMNPLRSSGRVSRGHR